MLLEQNQSLLLLVDVQEKLTPLVQESAHLIANCRWLLEIASLLSIPTIVSEQYPKGLGETVTELQQFKHAHNTITKVHFSCVDDVAGGSLIEKMGRQQIVLIGIESHVCILQTALGLVRKGKDVFVIANAVSSRNKEDKKWALKRMQQAGVQVVTKEMVVFEWLHRSDQDIFKTISKQYLR